MLCSECGAALHHGAEACPVCGSADGSGTLRRWERSLQAPERQTRRAALAALGRIGNVGAIGLLLRTLLRDAADRVDEREWEAAATALRAVQHPHALHGLLVFANVQEHADGDADALAGAIFARAEELSGGNQRDDIAIVVLRCAPLPAPLPPRPLPLAAITDGGWQ
jgi:hypothetical protein